MVKNNETKRYIYNDVFLLRCLLGKNQTDELGNICSDHNPYIWERESSGDPACYIKFCEMSENKDYSIEEGFKIAKNMSQH